MFAKPNRAYLEAMRRHPLFWLPNALTLMRCVLGVVVAYIIFMVAGKEASLLEIVSSPRVDMETRLIHQEMISNFRTFWGHVAFVIFALSAITDFFDGFLARRWGVESKFGRLLDPIADKIFVGVPLLTLAWTSGWPWPIALPVLVIVGRDVLITVLRFIGLGADAMKVNFVAKMKTFIEMILIAVFLLLMALAETPDPFLSNYLSIWTVVLWATASLSAYTGVVYIAGIIFLRFKKPEAEDNTHAPGAETTVQDTFNTDTN